MATQCNLMIVLGKAAIGDKVRKEYFGADEKCILHSAVNKFFDRLNRKTKPRSI